MGPIVLVLCRLAQSEVAEFTSVRSLASLMTLSPRARDALLLLVDSLEAFNGAAVRNESTAIHLSSFLDQYSGKRVVHGVLPHAIVASDASAHAVCAYDIQGAGGFFHQDPLSL